MHLGQTGLIDQRVEVSLAGDGNIGDPPIVAEKGEVG